MIGCTLYGRSKCVCFTGTHNFQKRINMLEPHAKIVMNIHVTVQHYYISYYYPMHTYSAILEPVIVKFSVICE